jgi:hypothetical protein
MVNLCLISLGMLNIPFVAISLHWLGGEDPRARRAEPATRRLCMKAEDLAPANQDVEVLLSRYALTVPQLLPKLEWYKLAEPLWTI